MANTGQLPAADQTPAVPSHVSSIAPAVLGASATITLFLALAILYTYPASESFRTSSLAASFAASKDRPLEIEAALSKNLFEGDENAPVPLTVSVLNRGTVALSDVQVCAEAPGFALKDADNCVSVKQVGPLQRATKQIPLTPLHHSGIGMITVRVSWNQAAAEMFVLRLGPVTIDPPFGAARWNRFGRRLASAFKDLTLPVILVVVGFWLNKMQADREDTRLDAEKKLADRKQVRLLLLGKVIKLAERHYLPIAAQSQNIGIEADRIVRNEPLSSPDKLFFHVMMLLRLREHMLGSSKQVVFLQKRTSEGVVAGALELIRSAAYGAMGEALVLKSLTIVGVDWSFADFVAKQDKLQEVQAAFEEWRKGTGPGAAIFGPFVDYLGVLDVLTATIQCEADRPLSADWYEEESTLQFNLPEPTEIPAGEKLPKHQRDQAEVLKFYLDKYLEAFYQRSVILKT